jgi:hypothetical protein
MNDLYDVNINITQKYTDLKKKTKFFHRSIKSKLNNIDNDFIKKGWLMMNQPLHS